MFYQFDQNNSGGVFDVDDKVCHRLFIEADSEGEACAKAEELGCYWDGVEKEIDCPCCGDRWYFPDVVNFENWGNKQFGSIEELAQYLANRYGWTNPDARIYYANGDVVEIYKTKEKKEK